MYLPVQIHAVSHEYGCPSEFLSGFKQCSLRGEEFEFVGEGHEFLTTWDEGSVADAGVGRDCNVRVVLSEEMAGKS